MTMLSTAMMFFLVMGALLFPSAARAEEVTCPHPDDAVTETSVQGFPLILSEFLPDPEGTDADGEFIEIFRPIGGSLLEGWSITDHKGRRYALDGLTVPEGGFLSLSYAMTGIPLVNGGGTLMLVAPDGAVTATIAYPSTKTGSSYARDANAQWSWTMPTPGAPNVFAVPTEEGAPEEDELPDEEQTPSPSPTLDASFVGITEFMPNPVGSDDLEWIELRNAGEHPFPLTGWMLDDDEGGSASFAFDADDVLFPGTTVFPRAITGLALNNTTDRVRLIAPDGTVHEDIGYADVIEGASYARIGEAWSWTDAPTPGEQNPEPTTEHDGPTDDGGVGEDAGTDIDEDRSDEERVFLGIEELDGIPDGDTVHVRAATTFVPGDIGKTMIGLQDETGALIARLYGDVPADLPHGALIEAQGKVTRMEGVVRLHVRAAALTIAETDALVPVAKAGSELTRDDEGAYVVLEGTVTDIRKTWFMLTDDGARTEVRVTLDASWPTELIVPGVEVRVTGTVRVTGDTTSVVPRTRGDIMTSESPVDEEGAAHGTTDEAEVLADADTDRTTLEPIPTAAQTGVVPALGIAGATVAGATTVAVTRKKRRARE